MNSRFLVLAGVLVSLFAMNAGAAGGVNAAGALGLGAEIGQPLGLTAKFWLSNSAAVDAALGYHFSDNFDMHADYLLHFAVASPSPNGSLALYAGLGGRILAGDDTQFGLRIPFGASYQLSPNRVELFAEIAPVVVLSDIGADVDGVAGVRFYAF